MAGRVHFVDNNTNFVCYSATSAVVTVVSFVVQLNLEKNQFLDHRGKELRAFAFIQVSSTLPYTFEIMKWLESHMTHRSGGCHGNPSCCSWIILSSSITLCTSSLTCSSFMDQMSWNFFWSIVWKCLKRQN